MASRDTASPVAASREDSGAEWDALLPGTTEGTDEDEDLGSVETSPFDAAIDRIGFGPAQVGVRSPRIDSCATYCFPFSLNPHIIRNHGQI